MSSILVVGAGAWGTALAIHAARAGHGVTLWARNPAPIAAARASPRLPGAVLPPGVAVTGAMPAGADAVLLVTPVQNLRAALAMALPDAPLVLCMKGLETGSHLLPMEVVRSVRPDAACAILTGPNFAHEVAAGLPAASVVASEDAALRKLLVGLLGSRGLRLYGSADPIGAQVGGAAKNVIAIAAGIAIGAGLGENARAAVVTRGLAEMSRLAVGLGGRAETIAGLSGMGDLMLTCSGASSRNYQFGVALGRGEDPVAALHGGTQAVEGRAAAPGLLARARAAGVEVPVIEALSGVLSGAHGVGPAMAALVSRPEREE
jgi:glycerol-3-phosphate dehydrogenase (NAD(P)+)